MTPKGTVRRISTAVLVDQNVRWEGVGAKAKKILVPPSAEVLKGVHDIIAGITGFSEQRGDQITVETLPFENTLEAEPPVAARRAGQTESPEIRFQTASCNRRRGRSGSVDRRPYFRPVAKAPRGALRTWRRPRNRAG